MREARDNAILEADRARAKLSDLRVAYHYFN